MGNIYIFIILIQLLSIITRKYVIVVMEVSKDRKAVNNAFKQTKKPTKGHVYGHRM